jgi:uncharacterized protein (DUF58 family)
MIPIPTQRFYLLLGLGGAIALILASLLPQSAPATRGQHLWLPLGLMLLWDLALLGLTLIDGLRVKPHRITATRQLPPRLSIGRDNPITLQLQSSSLPQGQSQTQIRLADSAPPSLGVSTLTGTVELSPQQETELTYQVQPDQRCELAWQGIQLRQLGPWGLAWHSWTVEQPQTTKVYPDLVGLRELTIKLALQSSGSLRLQQRMGMGTEFSELREYGAGDDLRLIDWKATARRGRPLVRVLEPEQEQTLLILLDRGRLMTAQVQGLQRFDWGVNAALALALAALHRGDRVGIGLFDKTMHRWIPPERSPSHLPRLLEQLSAIQPVLMEPDYLGAVGTVIRQQTRRALVLILTDIIDETASAELIGSLVRLSPRYLPFCVTLRDPELDRQAAGQSLDFDQAYARAVALDLLHQRQRVFVKLRQQGVMVLDAPAASISNQLVDQYLRIKARNRL